MRIDVLDHTGCGLGLALGLTELGHRVRYTGPEDWPGQPVSWVRQLEHELLQRYFGGNAPMPTGEADLSVLIDSFADHLAALAERRWLDRPFAPQTPLRAHCNPRIYPVRLQLWLELAQRCDRLAVVDSADARGPREVAFEALPHATCLAREVGLEGEPAWQPLPYLYNTALLWLERCQPATSWCRSPSTRVRRADWAFCGTVQHPRYGDRRQQALAELAARWPHRRGLVIRDAAFGTALAALQSVRYGLDLPGAGQLCYRLHECLALGVPLLRPQPFEIAMPAGLAAVFRASPDDVAPAPEPVQAAYAAHYAPVRAAEALLHAVATSVAGSRRAVAPAAG